MIVEEGMWNLRRFEKLMNQHERERERENGVE